MNNFKLEGTEGRDDGCLLSKTCQECPYVSGTVEFTAKCQHDYKKGKAGLVAEIRDSVISSMFDTGISVTMLARIFNVSKPNIRVRIARYWRQRYGK